MQRQDKRGGEPDFQPFPRAFDFPHAGQEGEDIPLLLAPGLRDGCRHGVFDPFLRGRAKPGGAQRVGPPLAFDHRRSFADQRSEPRTVDRRRHDQHTQILAQHGAAFERERKAEIAVEMPLVRLVEQYGRNTGELWIVEDHVDEDRLRHDQHAGRGAALAVEARQVADRLASLLAQQFGHAFGRCTRGNAAGRGQDDGAIAPVLTQQGGCHGSRLARPRRSDEHGAGAAAQCRQQVRQDSMDGKIVSHEAALCTAAGFVQPSLPAFSRIGLESHANLRAFAEKAEMLVFPPLLALSFGWRG